ncbi:MAG TPA: gamma-glutamyl-gamma-aminobutyrate hydrolase family protein, partial [Micromonosporaceae bacterium]
QDAFDLAVARVCLADGVPLLAVCRGLQVVTAVLGGTLTPDMGEGSHRQVVHEVRVGPESRLARVLGGVAATVSCYHHQCVSTPGNGMRPVAHAADGTPEAFELPDHAGWFLGVQWHPEDTAETDPAQAAVFAALVAAARDGRR